MNDFGFGWKKWKELPYRGEPKQKFPRRKRQTRNIKQEKKKYLILILGVAFVFVLGVGFIAMHPVLNKAEKITGIITVLVFSLPFAFPFSVGSYL